MDLQLDVLDAARALSLPVLSGGSCAADFRTALRHGASALKVYPSSIVTPEKLQQILAELEQDEGRLTAVQRRPLQPIGDGTGTRKKVFISGGVRPEQVEAYLRSGATDVIVGLDASLLSAEAMCITLQRYDEAVRQALSQAVSSATTAQSAHI
jgi:2-keto-3-deoxy-6-phosphogluconate aldolase